MLQVAVFRNKVNVKHGRNRVEYMYAHWMKLCNAGSHSCAMCERWCSPTVHVWANSTTEIVVRTVWHGPHVIQARAGAPARGIHDWVLVRACICCDLYCATCPAG